MAWWGLITPPPRYRSGPDAGHGYAIVCQHGCSYAITPSFRVTVSTPTTSWSSGRSTTPAGAIALPPRPIQSMAAASFLNPHLTARRWPSSRVPRVQLFIESCCSVDMVRSSEKDDEESSLHEKRETIQQPWSRESRIREAGRKLRSKLGM